MSQLFITGSGTGVGKTFISCLIIEQLRSRGVPVRALKPIVSGFDAALAESSDTGRLLAALDLSLEPAHIESVSPWRFRAALSPDVAAEQEQRSIHFDTVVAYCHTLDSTGLTIIEGVGGVMAPIDMQHTVIDWISALACPVVLVTGSYLGAISHTLTALSVLQARALPIRAIVVSQSNDEPMPVTDTTRVIERHADGTPVIVVPRLTDPADGPDLVESLDLEASLG